jgi:hypothetical protein
MSKQVGRPHEGRELRSLAMVLAVAMVPSTVTRSTAGEKKGKHTHSRECERERERARRRAVVVCEK